MQARLSDAGCHRARSWCAPGRRSAVARAAARRKAAARTSLPVLLVAFGSGWAAPLAGQISEAPASGVAFAEEIDVRVVNLEVVVEDRSGNRVQGLAADDFRIVVDGIEVDVDYFTEILESRAVESAGGEAPPAIGDGDIVPTNYLLFVDDDHTHVTSRRPVIRGFVTDLASLGQRDQVAVVVQSGRRLQVLSPFTTDRRRIRAALERIEWGRGFGGTLRAHRLIDQRYVVDRPVEEEGKPHRDISSDAPVGEDLMSADDDLPFASMSLPTAANQAQADSLVRDLEFSITAVSSTMRALQAPEGRKVLLLLAGNWPVGSFRLAGQGIGLRSDLEMLGGLVDTANVLGYTIYPVDQQTGPSLTRWQNLQHVADGTGGRTYVAGANTRALRQATEDVANYYWLGFVPDYRRDDRAHEVRVELRRPDLRARSRSGYVDLSRRAETDMDTQGRLLFPDLNRTGGEPLLQVSIGKPESTGIRKMRVPVRVYVPVGHFPAFPFEGRFLSRLELRFAVVDRNGQQAGIPVIPLDLASAAQPAPNTLMPFDVTLTLRRRPHEMVVSVHDPLTRQTVSARTFVSFRMNPTTIGGDAP